jgi:hypothetical protein
MVEWLTPNVRSFVCHGKLASLGAADKQYTPFNEAAETTNLKPGAANLGVPRPTELSGPSRRQ